MIYPATFLYTPGLSLKDIKKADYFGADVSVFDLEDSVPKDKKSLARTLLSDFFAQQEFKPLKSVRINSLRTRQGMEDVLCFIEHQFRPDIIIMTMVDAVDEIKILKDILSQGEINSRIYVTVETPQALTLIQKIAACCDGLILGSADLAAFLTVNITWDNMLYARQVIVNAAAIYNITAIDTACYILNSKKVLLEECRRVKELGFHGKAAVHPNQVDIINQVFYPAPNEFNLAVDIVNKYHLNEEKIFNMNGQMIGPPFVAKAKRLIERYSWKYNK